MQRKQVFSPHDGTQDDSAGQFKFCPLCGTALTLQERAGKQRPVCPNCGFVQFRNPLPGAVVVIEHDGSVLLGQRACGFGAGKWGLPQGFIEFGEDFLTAARREVKEETGLDIQIRSVVNVVSNCLSARLHTLAIVLLARVAAGTPRAADDLAALAWFPMSDPLPDMAFEADRWIIEYLRTINFADGLPVDPDFAGPGAPG